MKLIRKPKALIAAVVLAAALSGGGLAYAATSDSGPTVLTPAPGNHVPTFGTPSTPIPIGTVPSGEYGTGTTGTAGTAGITQAK